MNLFRRVTALLAIVAIPVPFLGGGSGVSGTHRAHDRVAVSSHIDVSDTVSAESGHCDGCGAEAPESPTPCEHGDVVPCASLSSCAYGSAIVVQSTNDVLESAPTVTRFDLDATPVGESASPEPPPPRA